MRNSKLSIADVRGCKDISANVAGRRTLPSGLTPDEWPAFTRFGRNPFTYYMNVLHGSLYALQTTIPHLFRSSMHRYLQHHRIFRLSDVDGDKPKCRKFKRYPIGYIHTDIAAQFLRNLVEPLPYKMHTICKDNSVWFTKHKQDTSVFERIFKRLCRANGIDAGSPKSITAGPRQVERMNRTIKQATVKWQHNAQDHQLQNYFKDFVSAYKYMRHLKPLNSLTPYEYICKL